MQAFSNRRNDLQDVTHDLFCLFCAENYGTEAASLLVFSCMYQNEIEMGMRIKLWDSKKLQRLRYKNSEWSGSSSILGWPGL